MISCKQTKGDKTWEQLKSLVARMGGMPDYPDPAFKPEAFRELCFALQCAESIASATKIVDDIVRYTDGKCPTPAALRRLANDRPITSEPRAPDPDCILCADAGLVGGTADTPWNWCGCPAGVRLREITPELVDEANRTLDKIRGKFPKGAPGASAARKVMA